MDRRAFLKTSTTMGSGLIIGFHLPGKKAWAQQGAAVSASPPNAFVRIAPDNSVTVISKHTEMGQGVYTGLATLLAEELDADWSQVRVEAAPADQALYRHFMLGIQGTGGSSSIPNSWIQYRTVGAQARAMLVSAAAASWGVPEEEIRVAKGMLSHASGHSGSFGEFSNAAGSLPVPGDVPLKSTDQFTLIGTNVAKVDMREKVDGTAKFTIDVRRPGMLVAVVAHSPRFGGTLVSFDDSAALDVPGVVEVVQIPRGVAVLARNTWAAIQGRDALMTEWDFSAAENRGSEEIIRDFTAMTEQPGKTVEKKNDSTTALDTAAQTIDASYVFPYLAHACMEPLDYTIEMVDGRCIARAGTQMPGVEKERIAEVLGLDPEDVEVETLYAGGGFGRRGNFVPDMEVEAASILRATNGRYPIKLIYTREDDTRGGFYRPLFVHRMKGGVDADGNIIAWENRLVGQSFVEGSMFSFLVQNGVDQLAVEGAAHLPYDVPNVNVDFHMARAGVPTLAWRSVGHTHTAFSRETFLDALFHLSGRDPVQGRLDLMDDPRAIAVLRKAAELANWDKPAPEGVGRGVAYVHSFNTWVAEVAEISLSSSGAISVDRVVAVVDCGLAVNPHIVEAQMESAIMYGLSAALYGEIRIEEGEVLTGNFDTYPVIRMNQAPEIQVHIMPSGETPTGIGEPGLPPIAPAVANAYFQLTGKRVTRLPFEPSQA